MECIGKNGALLKNRPVLTTKLTSNSFAMVKIDACIPDSLQQRNLNMDMKEKGLSFFISLRVCYVCPSMLWPLTLPLSPLCLHGYRAKLIRHSNVIINPDRKCHIKQESRESTLHILQHAISKSSSSSKWSWDRLTCVTWVKLQAGANLVFRKHLLCQLFSAVKTRGCRLGIRPV